MKKSIALFFLLFIGILGCKSKPKENAKKAETRKEQGKTPVATRSGESRSEVSKNLENYWFCYKYEKDESQPEAFPENYAKEYSRYAHFKLTGDSIYLDENRGEPIYSYWHSTRKKGYDVESYFLHKFQPKEEKVEFIAQHIGSNKIDPFTLFMRHNGELILRDRGFFFHFKKDMRKAAKDFQISGCPGDTRNHFVVKHTFLNQSLEQAYQNFKKDFPYGAEGLEKELGKKSHYQERTAIHYEIEANHIQIAKEVPHGTVKIEFRTQRKDVILRYEMQYPEY